MKKKKNQAGFTLGEMLVAVLIMLMASTILVSGIPAAKNAYEKVVLASNAQALLSTTIAALRDELGTATDIKKLTSSDTGTYLSYYSADIGSRSQLFLEETDGKKIIKLREFAQDENLSDFGIISTNASKAEARPLLTNAASSGDVMYVTFDIDNVTIANDSVTIPGLKVCSKNNEGLVLADLGEGSEGLTIKTYTEIAE